jgi:hypothetical protein
LGYVQQKPLYGCEAVLAAIGTTWTVIGVVVILGLGIMLAVANSGRKDSIQINGK